MTLTVVPSLPRNLGVPCAIAAALIFQATPQVAAQDWNCSDFDNLPQQGMNYCVQQEFVTADAELNRVYKRVRTILRSTAYDAARSDGRTEAEALRDAQRAWIAYRDQACAMEGIHFRGGSMEPLLVAACLRRLTERRTQDLWLLVETGAGEQ